MNTPARSFPSIEALEARIAPAALAIAPGGKVATFTDIDGDLVTVTVSKGVLETNDFMLTMSGVGYSFDQLNLSGGNHQFDKTNVSIMAKPSADGGDGHVNIAFLNAVDNDLSTVIVDGDLGALSCGNSMTSGLAVKSLTAASLCLVNQGIVGALGGAGTIKVLGSMGPGQLAVSGSVDSVEIKGSLIGSGGGNSGQISLPTTGSFKIGGSIIGGGGGGSGLVTIASAKSVFIGGDIIGGGGGGSGYLSVTVGAAGTFTLRGGLIGGDGTLSGSATVTGGKISVGLLEGGAGNGSGEINVYGSKSSVLVKGTIRGGMGDSSGSLVLPDGATTVTARNGLAGGGGKNSGSIYTTVTPDGADDAIRSLTITGDVLGGAGELSGAILAGQIPTFKLNGSFIGGAGDFSAYLQVNAGTQKTFTVTGDVHGGEGDFSGAVRLGHGQIPLFGGIGKIGGSIIGGSGSSSGRADFSLQYKTLQNAINLSVGGSVIGGSGDSSGGMAGSGGNLITVGGSIIGGSANHTGEVSFVGVTTAKIGGSIIGGDLDSAAANDVDLTGGLEFNYVGKVTIGGSVYAGTDFSATKDLKRSGFLYLQEAGTVQIGGGLFGSTTDRATLVAAKSLSDGTITIGQLSVAGSVDHADILVGYDHNGAAFTADTSIGTVTVGGDWVASNLVVGVAIGADARFGTADDALIAGGDPAKFATLASLIIKGQALGTAGGTDHFGIVAEKIGAISVGGTAPKLTAADDVLNIGPTMSGEQPDFTAREDV